MGVSAQAWQAGKRQVDVLGRRMAYAEVGEGRPVVFLHGNPTSSFLWRDVMAEVAGQGRRLLAPDLIGMGDSDKLPVDEPNRYTFARHSEFLDAFLTAVQATSDVTLVVHDWGSALGFDWARRHPEAVAGVAYMEAIVAPYAGWEDWPESVREIFQAFRSPAGEELVLEHNAFVEQVLPGAIIRQLAPDELDEYRRPFQTPGEDRRPTLTWPRQLPIAGEPADVVAAVHRYGAWLASAPGVPKLFVNADPGALTTGAARDFCRSWPDQHEITVPGVHFVQEDSGAQIGAAIGRWLRTGTPA